MIKPCPHCKKEFEDNHGVRYCSFECRLWSKIEVRGENECWLWKATGKDGDGYGSVMLPDQRNVNPHRAIYEMLHGALTRQEYVCHSCDNKLCCNPNHLWLGSNTDNMRDASKKGLLAHGERNNHAKLTVDKVKIIRSMPFEIFSYEDIGNLLGCSGMTINRIVKRETWKHVGG